MVTPIYLLEPVHTLTPMINPTWCQLCNLWIIGRSNVDLSDLDVNSNKRGFVIQGVGIGQTSGANVANAGDVNADGYADLVIGSLTLDLYLMGKSCNFWCEPCGLWITEWERLIVKLASNNDINKGFVVQGDRSVEIKALAICR